MAYAKVSRRTPKQAGAMNKLEAEYGAYLKSLVLAGEIQSFSYESVKLRLATKTFYTPDYLVIAKDGTVEMHEVKGFWEDDARVKIKVAAELFPFKFIAIRKLKGAWSRENF